MLVVKQCGLKSGTRWRSAAAVSNVVDDRERMQWLRPAFRGRPRAFELSFAEWSEIMNIRKISEWAVIAIVAVIVTLIATNQVLTTTVKRDKQGIDIEYKVNAAADKLEITLPATDNCNGGAKTGCFKIKKNKKGWIKFVFNGDAEQWVLNQFTLCPTDTKIGDACPRPLTIDEQLEFFVMDDPQGTMILPVPASGQVGLAPLPAGSKTFYLFDQNTIEQMYFYNIRVCTVPDPNIPQKCLTLDPPIENKGLN